MAGVGWEDEVGSGRPNPNAFSDAVRDIQAGTSFMSFDGSKGFRGFSGTGGESGGMFTPSIGKDLFGVSEDKGKKKVDENERPIHNAQTRQLAIGKYHGELDEAGNPHGRGELEFKGSGDKYRGDWDHGKVHGQGTFKWHNGDIYEGEWADNLKEGYGTFSTAKGMQYAGEWSKGVIDGKGTMVTPNGEQYTGQWKNNKKDGSGVTRDPRGKVFEETWKDGALVSRKDAGEEYISRKGTPAMGAGGSGAYNPNSFLSSKITSLLDDGGDSSRDSHMKDMLAGTDWLARSASDFAGSSAPSAASGNVDASPRPAASKLEAEGITPTARQPEQPTKARPGQSKPGSSQAAPRSKIIEHNLSMISPNLNTQSVEEAEQAVSTRMNEWENLSTEKEKGLALDSLKIQPNTDAGQWVASHSLNVGLLQWTRLEVEGGVYEGQMNQKDAMEGHGSFNFPSGDVYEGQWINGATEGFGIFNWKSGEKYVGQWKENNKHGYGEMTMGTGTTYRGAWDNGNINGYGVMEKPNGDIYAGEFKNAKKHGKGITIESSGRAWEVVHEEGRLNHIVEMARGNRAVEVQIEAIDKPHQEGRQNHEGALAVLARDVKMAKTVFSKEDSATDSRGDHRMEKWLAMNEQTQDVDLDTVVYSKKNAMDAWLQDNERLDIVSHGASKACSTVTDKKVAGGKYTGEVDANELMSGNGTLIYDTGDTYQGQWYMGKACGRGIFTWKSGDVYEGTFRDNHKDGYGVLTGVDGTIFDGEWKDGTLHGLGLLLNAATKDRFEGEWKHNAVDGKGVRRTKGSIYEEEWKDGKRISQSTAMPMEEGEQALAERKNMRLKRRKELEKLASASGGLVGSQWNRESYNWLSMREAEQMRADEAMLGGEKSDEKNPSVMEYWNRVEASKRDKKISEKKGTISAGGNEYSGELDNDGNMHGRGEMTWSNGDKYIGEWDNNRLSGSGRFLWANGNNYTGDWLEDKMHGSGTYVYKDGSRYVGDFCKGFKHGYGKFHYHDGDVYQGQMAFDRKEGVGVLLSTLNRTQYDGEWKNDVAHGHGVLLEGSGASWEGTWSYNQKDGVGVYLDKVGNGRLETWEDGKKLSSQPMAKEAVDNHKKESAEKKSERAKITAKAKRKDPSAFYRSTAAWEQTDPTDLFHQVEDDEAKAFAASNMKHYIDDKPGLPRLDKLGRPDPTLEPKKLRSEVWAEQHPPGTAMPVPDSFIDMDLVPAHARDLTARYRTTQKLEHGVYSGEVDLNGKQQGIGLYVFNTGDRYGGLFRDGAVAGIGAYHWVNGDTYEGEWSDNIKNGFGIMRAVDGGMYIGAWVDGSMEGEGSQILRNKDTFDGTFKNNKRHGDFLVHRHTPEGEQFKTEIWEDGVLKFANFISKEDYNARREPLVQTRAERVKHLKTALAAIEMELGGEPDERPGLFPEFHMTIFDEGVFLGKVDENGQRNGEGQLTWWHGDKYFGQWVDNKADGEGTFTWANKDSYVGQLKAGLRHGRGKFFSKSGAHYEGQWDNGLMAGDGALTMPNGDVYSGQFKDGKKHGLGFLLNGDGVMYEERWEDGEMKSQSEVPKETAAMMKQQDGFKSSSAIGAIVEAPGQLVTMKSTVANATESEDKSEPPKVVSEDFCKDLPPDFEASIKVPANSRQFASRFGWGRRFQSYIEGLYDAKGLEDGRKSGSKVYRDGGYIGQFNVIGQRDGNGCYRFASGDTYDGEWRSNLTHGEGMFSWQNGDVYVGQWKYNERHGVGQLVAKTGVIYEGHWKKSIMEGYGELRNENTVESFVGFWKNGLKHGPGIHTTSSGHKYIGEWSKDKRTGRGVMEWKSGAVYGGEWVDDNREGQGHMLSLDGSQFIGRWENDKKNGEGTVRYASGDVFQGAFKDNEASGYGKMMWSSGDKYEGQWDKNTRDGHGKLSLKSGEVYDGEWKANEMHGRGSLKFPNGECYEGTFLEGQKHGSGAFFNANNQEFAQEWKFGKLIKSERRGVVV